VSIEARFISVSDSFLESIGADLDFYFNLGSRLNSGTAINPWTGVRVPATTGLPFAAGQPGNSNWTPIAAQQNNSFGNVLGVSSPIGSSSIGSSVVSPAGTVQGTFLDDIQVNFLLQATQASRTVRSMTAPRLTLLSGTTAWITVGSQISYAATTTANITANQNVQTTIFNTTPGQLNVGTNLSIGATVSADLKYVTLTVHPSITRLVELVPFSSGDSNDPNVISTTIQLPNIQVQELETTVNVPDGATLLLGGLKSSGEVEREEGVPLLSKIPILNRGFDNRGKVRDQETLLILIKPTIMVPRDDEKQLFP